MTSLPVGLVSPALIHLCRHVKKGEGACGWGEIPTASDQHGHSHISLPLETNYTHTTSTGVHLNINSLTIFGMINPLFP